MRTKACLMCSLALTVFAPAAAFAQRAPVQVDPAQAPYLSEQKDEAADQAKDGQTQLSPTDELKTLQLERREMQQRLDRFDARIDALESKLGVQHAPPPTPAATVATPTPLPLPGQTPEQQQAAAEPAKNPVDAFLKRSELAGTFKRDTGWVLVDEPFATEYLGLMTYARYLNQNALNPTYTDSFGRVIEIDRRNEVQLYKVSLQFKGWLFTPKFSHLIFIWTNNANQGEGAQVAVAGFLRYQFAKWLSVSAGIMPLPTTRSTNYSFPKWLRHDNRVMADEFYRGSYTSGIDALGTIAPGLEYRAMIGNNLSTLGVSSKQLDNKFDTYSGSLVWMPTTKEFGLAEGFGDYDYHDKVATLIGLHYTHSTETAQGQPAVDSFENSQIRLTDGTLLFSPDPFGTGGKVEEARYRMASIDAGIKYRGFSLEGQWYWRWVDKFKTLGTIPVDEIKDNGVAVQLSGMPIKDYLQAYVTYSKIWGENGNPNEYALGLDYYPFGRREMHVNLEAIHLDRSPVGGYHIPVPVGGKGWVFLTDWVLMF
jgi:hypothetical protein